ncbi:S8 family serine peptidase [Staphylococcus hyicus]|uniref:S8 family serine peptidase n=1 Tax=Staphylococcus hyicus TaxID=1284 RepID=A0ACD5FNE1_STAHY|nr:S8 family serine peptidase [Staphylococcus hyicus]AJC95806.1 subtilase family protease [Staphylococcus hyicus]MDP4462589.1 S8 family serine peptidase [Staphylococcus hyicus]MDY3698802.1 S8 family serine peptidase [Staphylococcus hyicus]RTX66180.1 peptidase [Staphylococcus hyicus]SQE47304.1 subtilase family protease [Staphylococcus hyicus]
MNLRLTFSFSLFFIIIITSFIVLNDRHNNWAWDILKTENQTYQKNNLKVAILDSGIKNKRINDEYVVKRYDAIKNNNQFVTSSNHGSQVASIISYGKSSNTLIGVNKNVDIYDVKVLDDNLVGTPEDIARGIEWCIKYDVNIINMSFGIQKYDPDLHKIIKKANDKGIILVGAAGNNLDNNSDFPARFKEVYSITAIDKDKQVFLYSPNKNIDFRAPGVDVYTLNGEDKIVKDSGSSFSAAYFTSYLIANVDSTKNFIDTIKNYPLKYKENET